MELFEDSSVSSFFVGEKNGKHKGKNVCTKFNMYICAKCMKNKKNILQY